MLQIKNISKTYKTGTLIQKALNNVSLNLRDNEFVAILGPSGSGKTTLLNIIGGLDKYDSGDLIINNISTKDYKDRDWDSYRNHTIGFVFQSYNLIPHQSVLRNVELALTIAGISSKERKARALEALRQVGLDDQAHKKPNQMSGGQMQRVAIARALVNNPSILLADEPTGALDTKTSIQVMELLKEVAKDRLVVMVTHNPELAEKYANRTVNLRDGDIIGDSNPYIVDETVLEKPKKKNMGKAHMSIFTALSLSFNNLLTKKGRTILTAFAGSVGIIGIALILALSTGFQNYIDQIQEETMSSYPLTIQKETANIFGALLSAKTESDENVVDGKITEQMMVASMMNSVGTNDLTTFKKWLEDNPDKYSGDVKNITYQYSVSPLIYTKDVTNEYVQINPNTLMSTFYNDTTAALMSSLSSSTSMGTFSEYETEDLQEKCELLAGKWPSKYNEVIIVLSEKGKIPDLLTYSLGLRDMKELKTIVTEVMAGEQSKIENTPMTLNYENLMDVELKLINPTNFYKYNEKYDPYEDMSDDKDYVQSVYEKAEKLNIVGIAYSTDDNTTIAGVIYSHALVDYVINTASKSEIVQKQLANKDVDVFSGNRFDEEKEESGLEFNDMVSVDEDVLKDAFKVNIDEDDFKALIKEQDIKDLSLAAMEASKEAAKTIPSISAGISTINSAMLQQMTTAFELTLVDQADPTKGFMFLDMSTDPTNPTLLLTTKYPDPAPLIKNYEMYAENAITATTYKAALEAMSEYAPEMKAMVSMFSEKDGDYTNLANSLKKSFIAYYDKLVEGNYGYDAVSGKCPVSVTLIPPTSTPMISSYGKQAELTATITKEDLLTLALSNTYAIADESKVIERVVTYVASGLVAQGAATSSVSEAANILKGMGNLFGEDMMSIDTDKFAEAFNFDMDEDELSRLMTSMMTDSKASYSNNLVGLGYQDEDDPTSISIYFNDFNSKENFLNLLDEYNKNADEDTELTYTDITGMLISSVQTIVNAVTYVLIAFVSISLVVSSIMIAVITLISVMERTKEIGILRAMGASKRNVSSIFNAETFIIGLLSGVIGVVTSWLATFPINDLIHDLTDIEDINSVLYLKPAIVLVIISVVLTMVAGFIPSKKAAKQDPVIALRTE